jgi:DNA-directed RNA polymerase specialized sigma24 family protein
MPPIDPSEAPPAAVLPFTGDTSARWVAVLAHARRAAAGVLGLPMRHPDVEDRAQDALVAFLAAGRFDPRQGTLEAYVGTIARRLALSHRRDRATQGRLDSRFAQERSGAVAPPQHRLEAAHDLSLVLDRLCSGHAEALVRIDLVGEPIADAAARLGKSYQAMNGQVGHARAAARRVALELEVA